MLGIMHARILASLRIVSNRICVHPVSRTLVVRGPEIVQPIEFFFFSRNQIFLLSHSISSINERIIVVSNNTPTHRSIRYREIDRCRNSGNTVISVIGRAYRTRLFIYIYTYLDAISAATAFSRSIGALCFFRARASNDQLTALCPNILSMHSVFFTGRRGWNKPVNGFGFDLPALERGRLRNRSRSIETPFFHRIRERSKTRTSETHV